MSDSIDEQLTQLSQLHTQGSLTDEEFAAAKKRALDGAESQESGNTSSSTGDLFVFGWDGCCSRRSSSAGRFSDSAPAFEKSGSVDATFADNEKVTGTWKCAPKTT